MGNNTEKLLFGVLTAGLILCLGCQSPDKNIERREKLYAHARYQLSGELAQKDKEIEGLTRQLADLKKQLAEQTKLNDELSQKDRGIEDMTRQIAELKKQLAEQTKLADDCSTKQAEEFMAMIGPITDELTQAQAENEQLKAQLQKLSGDKAPQP